mmetsp:Transcript_25365/g.54095  ORF Transcript_25365/g.54095 Transcript_25365/m.54095 type:complete len:137 (-) Transcript_25365:238-648(-)
MVRSISFSVSLSLLALGSTNGFAPTQQQKTISSTSLNGFGDAFKSAFSNDDSLGERKNEGLAGGPNYNENVSMNGKNVPNVVVGQKLTVVGGKARVKIPVNCQAGDCGTCVVKMNGRKVKACQTQVPKGKCNIQTL